MECSVVHLHSKSGRYRYIHQHWYSSDGKFKAQKKKKNDDSNNISLGNGNTYFTEDQTYQKYLNESGESQEKSMCAHLKAVNMQNKTKFKNVEVTGVVMMVCAHHGLILPRSVVNLQKGERYANVDYALTQALREAVHLPFLGFMYDVTCQYIVNIRKCFKQSFPHLVPTLWRILPPIPKMHLQGSKDDCMYAFSLNYLEGAGQTSGKLVETVWHELNDTNGSTIEMNAGHCHDYLDDMYGDWNWNKVQKIGAFPLYFVYCHWL
ncbi:hypothetical protein K439DRAFT_1333200 [Ramaria rubella]|nr:hypothetical protein K439DRAFT_1333200 [Ramaria rubella]